jgi:hypothetical protein
MSATFAHEGHAHSPTTTSPDITTNPDSGVVENGNPSTSPLPNNENAPKPSAPVSGNSEGDVSTGDLKGDAQQRDIVTVSTILQLMFSVYLNFI